jgi:hypothetical protein
VRERELLLFIPLPKKRGRKKIGYLLTQVLLPYFFTLGKNGHPSFLVTEEAFYKF